uniref:CSON000306 protein n=1 Tax=Culicoides sonorensis TaxID=179676 RepID=A0A336MIH2_CULSO
MKRGVVLAAVSTHNAFFANHTQTYHHYNGTYRKNGHSGLHGANGTNLHGNVNMLLGGAMLAVVATVVFIVCYCCHRNIKRRSESIYRQQWFEADPNMEIFSVEQCFDTPSLYMEQRSDSGVSITSNQNGPPPSYEAVVALDGIRKCSNVNCPLGKTMNIDNNDDDINKNGLILEDMEPPSHTDDGLNNDDNDKFYGDKCNKNNNNFDDDQEQQQQQFTCHRCTTTRQSDAPNQSNNNLCDCNNLIDGGTLCRNCGEYITDNVVTNCTQIDGNNKCYYDYLTSVSNPNGQIVDEDNNTEHDHQQQQQHQIEMLNNVNNNNNSMGTGDDSSIQQINYNNNTNNNNGDMDSNRSNNETLTTGNDNNNNNATTTSVDLQSFNENGLIRLDMSQIIDSTGLPTYEAAIKLEQSGYV